MAGRLIDSAGVTVFEGTAVGIGGSGAVLSASITLTVAQVNAANADTAAVQIVAAPGAGKIICPTDCIVTTPAPG